MSDTDHRYDLAAFLSAVDHRWPRGTLRRRVLHPEIRNLTEAVRDFLAEPPPAPRSAPVAAPVETDWPVEPNVLCVVCPECGFTFDAAHVDVATGAYSCPVCCEAALAETIEVLESLLVRFRKGHHTRNYPDGGLWWMKGHIAIDPVTPAHANYLEAHPMERR